MRRVTAILSRYSIGMAALNSAFDFPTTGVQECALGREQRTDGVTASLRRRGVGRGEDGSACGLGSCSKSPCPASQGAS